MMVAPRVTYCQYSETFISVMPLLRQPRNSTPSSVPQMRPLPPNRLVPPMMVAAMTSSSMPVAAVPLPEPICEAISRPLIAVSAPVMASAAVFTPNTSMPDRREASALPPTAYTARPNEVYFMRKCITTNTVANTNTGKGMPATLPAPKKSNQPGKVVSGKPPVRRLAKPLSAANSASVVMNDGTLNHWRILPVKTPQPAPTISAVRLPTATAPPAPRLSVYSPQTQPRMQPANATPEPTDRSISPQMITAVMPKAMMPSMETVRSTLRKLPSVA